MKPTSFTESGIGPTHYGRLLDRAKAMVGKEGNEVYILAVPKCDISLEEFVEACADIPEARTAIDVNGTVDVIITGDAAKAEDIGRAIFRHTGQHVGSVKYDSNNLALYLNLRAAIRQAEREGVPYHTYNPLTDSISARGERLREKYFRRE